MIKKYQNKEWLENKYQEQILSQKDIGKICKVAGNTIGYYLRKFNIPIRSRGEYQHLATGNHCNLSQKTIEWINGELLGDGCLQSRSPWSARFTYSSKHKEYIEYIRDTLKYFGIKQAGKIYKIYHKERNYYDYRYESRCYIELLSIRKQWYPKGKKIVPKDIKLTPITCRQWYIGDGYLIYQKKHKTRIRLATCGFLISNVNYLIRKLKELDFKIARQPHSNIIGISSYSTKNFLDYIGRCPVKCYQYKWAC